VVAILIATTAIAKRVALDDICKTIVIRIDGDGRATSDRQLLERDLQVNVIKNNRTDIRGVQLDIEHGALMVCK
jgi:hypothetical protein